MSKGASSETRGTSDSGRGARWTGTAGCESRFKSESFQVCRSSARDDVDASSGTGMLASSARRPWSRRRRSTNVSFEISLNVSVTPRPADATASTKG